MPGQQRHIAVVPAKLKSRRCKDKNWKEFSQGQSLAELAFRRAFGCGYFDVSVLSIDFPKSKVMFKDYGNYVVRRRPRLLGKGSLDVLLDALEYVGAEEHDVYALIQPTSPFVSKETLWRVLQQVKLNNSTCVTVNPAYKPSGGVYAGYVGFLRQYKSLYRPFVVPLVLDWMESIDIDYDYDFEIARCLRE